MVSEKIRRRCARWAVGLSLVSSPLALADPPNNDPLASRESREQESSPQLINLKFAGGTAAQFVEAIRTTDARPNVVINDATLLGYVPVPPVELISVTVQGALSILERCRALDSQGREIELFTTFEQGKEPRGGGMGSKRCSYLPGDGQGAWAAEPGGTGAACFQHRAGSGHGGQG